ncbi:type I secretion system permease/ATPase [Immundisolibacter sp.]
MSNTPGGSELRQALVALRAAFVGVGAFSACINLLLLAPAIYMLQVYDRVLSSHNAFTLLMLSLILAGLYVLYAGLEWVRSLVLVRVGMRLDAALDARVFDATFERGLRGAAGNAAQALGDLQTVRQFLTGNGVFAFFDAPWAPVYLLVVTAFHPWLGIATLVGVIVLVALNWIMHRVTHEPLTQAQRLSMRTAALVNNNLRNAEVIESMGMLGNLRERWFRQHAQILQLQGWASDRAGTLAAASRFVRLAMQSLALGLGAWLVLDGKMTPGMMIAGSILAGRALAPVDLLIGSWRGFLSARDAYGRLGELLSAFPVRQAGLALPPPRGDVQLDAVTAVPPGGRQPVLRNMSLQIAAGQVVGVVGPSGAGKSSLARLLVGVWPAAGGSVRLDGADVMYWDKARLGPYIGYLPQDVELFEGSIAENIARFGQVDADQVIEAARLAGVHDMILHFPDGYDTQIGVGGAVLSGGQRQRIGLARAVYGQPVLIVLDEPNSNLDDIGEAALVQAVRELKQAGRTVVLITHRTNVLATVDNLLVLRDGQVLLYGPRDEVLARLQASNVVPVQRGATAAP